MQINLVGINYQAAPVAILEKAAIRAGKLEEALSLLGSYVAHGVILSTCNRTEVYTAGSSVRQAEEASLDFLKAHLDISDADLRRYAYRFSGEAVAEHLFRVAGGLDSMVGGEFEVLGQVKKALDIAEKAKKVNLPLRHIFQSAIRAGRRVREETGISKKPLSVSSVAVDLAARVVGKLSGCKLLVIGAGEAGRLVAKAAKERGAKQIVVASRTPERASALTIMLGGQPIGMDNLAEELATCNIVVACADAPHRLLDARRVDTVMKNRSEPMVIIDIAVPRNVAPAVAEIDNVVLYNIDDLTQIADQNRQQREEEIEQAEVIIAAELARFVSWWRTLEVRPVISALMGKAEKIRRSQLNRTLKKLPPLTDEEKYCLEMMTRSITSQILQDPVKYLKANLKGNEDYAEIINRLFHLETEKEK